MSKNKENAKFLGVVTIREIFFKKYFKKEYNWNVTGWDSIKQEEQKLLRRPYFLFKYKKWLYVFPSTSKVNDYREREMRKNPDSFFIYQYFNEKLGDIDEAIVIFGTPIPILRKYFTKYPHKILAKSYENKKIMFITWRKLIKNVDKHHKSWIKNTIITSAKWSDKDWNDEVTDWEFDKKFNYKFEETKHLNLDAHNKNKDIWNNKIEELESKATSGIKNGPKLKNIDITKLKELLEKE